MQIDGFDSFSRADSFVVCLPSIGCKSLPVFTSWLADMDRSCGGFEANLKYFIQRKPSKVGSVSSLLFLQLAHPRIIKMKLHVATKYLQCIYVKACLPGVLIGTNMT